MTQFGTHDYQLTQDQETRADRLHNQCTIVDAIWWGPATYQSFTPEMNAALRARLEKSGDIWSLIRLSGELAGRLAVSGDFPEYRQLWDASGVTAGHWAVEVGDARLLLEGVAYVDHVVGNLPWLRKAIVSDDFRAAKRDGGHALYLQCQPVTPISRDFGLVDLAYDAGLRMLQLSYNVQDLIACGCTEKTGAGVSQLGWQLIGRLNQLGVIVDTSHCNEQTVLDACRISERPVAVSHTAAATVYAHDRGISDRAAEAVAATGGFVGVAALPAFLGSGKLSVEVMLDHIDHFAKTIGWQHVGIGTDWPTARPKWLLEKTEELILESGFRSEHAIVPTQNLIGFDDYRDFPNITRGLVARGYDDEQIRGILGENFLRVFGEVCD